MKAAKSLDKEIQIQIIEVNETTNDPEKVFVHHRKHFSVESLDDLPYLPTK
jgi:hypothetical protein